MADKIVVMEGGNVEQIGAPLELYDRPDNLFVAGFIGSPAMNFLRGRVAANGAQAVVTPSGERIPTPGAPGAPQGKEVILGIRPEHLTLVDGEDGFGVEVVVTEPTGSEVQVVGKHGADDIIAVFRERHQPAPGERLRLAPTPENIHLFDAETGRAIRA